MTFILENSRSGKTREFETRAEAEDQKQQMVGLGVDPEDLEITQAENPRSDGGPEVEMVDHTPEDTEEYDLPEDGPSVDEDPLVWMPDEFTDQIDGTVAINRKGFEVIAHHYGIECKTNMVILPTETNREYVAHEAVATDAEGHVYAAYGEADQSEVDTTQLIRMSDTRAYKRAVSRASGVGMVAVEELQGEL
jgi:hypothetical protein